MRKEKLRKAGLCFTSGCFIKHFKMIINHIFYFWSSFAVQFRLFDIRDIKRGNWKLQIARNGNLNTYLKNNFNLLVMNVTQSSFLYRQNVHIWQFIKVNQKISLLFLVVPTLSSWSRIPPSPINPSLNPPEIHWRFIG